MIVDFDALIRFERKTANGEGSYFWPFWNEC